MLLSSYGHAKSNRCQKLLPEKWELPGGFPEMVAGGKGYVHQIDLTIELPETA